MLTLQELFNYLFLDVPLINLSNVPAAYQEARKARAFASIKEKFSFIVPQPGAGSTERDEDMKLMKTQRNDSVRS